MLLFCRQDCQDCMQQVLDLYLWDAADKPAEVQAAAFEAACLKQAAATGGDNETISMCRGIAASIFKDPGLGNRAGRLCMMFGSCRGLPSNCSITVVGRNSTIQTGALTTCTVSGVTSAKVAASVTSAGEGRGARGECTSRASEQNAPPCASSDLQATHRFR
jgi:hypothetical protein